MYMYKYFSPELLSLVFARDGFASIKCSTPDQYNDPYELFLGVDTNVSTDLLAAYQELVQALPQLPTTCFSRSPTVTPMWAHYAANHSGFVLEFDVDAVKEAFPEASIHDVSYKDAPDGTIESALQRAAVTKKPRHAVWLQHTVFTEAYFSKQISWAYEQECRLVDNNDYVEDVSGNKILYVPLEGVTSLIVGKNCPAEVVENSLSLASRYNIRWLKAQIGRVRAEPFFVSKTGTACAFETDEICDAEHICASCREPVPEARTLCAWCAVTDAHRITAARNNPLRLLDRVGLLNEYYEGVDKIERGRR